MNQARTTTQLNSDQFIMISCRFETKVVDAAKKIILKLGECEPPIRAELVDAAHADPIHDEVFGRLGSCRCVLVMGSKSYGARTRTQGNTMDEWDTIHEIHKPKYLIRMAPRGTYENIMFNHIFARNCKEWLPDPSSGKWGEPSRELIEDIAKQFHLVKHRWTRPQLTLSIGWEHIVGPITEAGAGANGKVYRAKWLSRDRLGEAGAEVDVAVKVLWSTGGGDSDAALATGIQEAEMMAAVWRDVIDKDIIVRVFGVAKGEVTEQVARAFNIRDDAECVGIVMRFEGGGTLHDLIHARPQPHPHAGEAPHIVRDGLRAERHPLQRGRPARGREA